MLLTNMAKKGPHVVVKDAVETLQLRIGLKGLQSSIYLDKSLRELFTAGIDNVFKRYMNEVRTFMEIAILRAETENSRNQWQYLLKELISNYQAHLEEIEQYAQKQEQFKSQINQGSKQEQLERELQLTDLHQHISTALIDLQSVYQIFTKEWHDIPKTIVTNMKEYQQLQAEDRKIVDHFMASKIPADPKKLQKVLSATNLTPKQALTRANSHLELTTASAAAMTHVLNQTQHIDPATGADQLKKIHETIAKKIQAIDDQETNIVKLQSLAGSDVDKIDEAQNAVKKLKDMQHELQQFKKSNSDILYADRLRNAHKRRSIAPASPSAIKDVAKYARINELLVAEEKKLTEQLSAKLSAVADDLDKMIHAKSAQPSLKMAGG